jgi:hypothetical protein
VYAQSFGMPIPDTGRDVWRQVVRDLIERCAPPCPVRSLTAGHHPVRPMRPAGTRCCRDAAGQYGATAGSSVLLAPMRAAAVLPLRAAGTCVPAAARPNTGMLP